MQHGESQPPHQIGIARPQSLFGVAQPLVLNERAEQQRSKALDSAQSTSRLYPITAFAQCGPEGRRLRGRLRARNTTRSRSRVLGAGLQDRRPGLLGWCYRRPGVVVRDCRGDRTNRVTGTRTASATTDWRLAKCRRRCPRSGKHETRRCQRAACSAEARERWSCQFASATNRLQHRKSQDVPHQPLLKTSPAPVDAVRSH